MLRPGQLKDGRVCFQADVSKSRRACDCRLPPDLYRELLEVSGPDYVFETFAEQLRAAYASQGRTRNAAPVGPFCPRQVAKWLQERLIAFRQTHPDSPYWKLHSLRATAISEVRGNGVPAEKAAIFFGVTPQVMATHYEALDETAIADEVAEARQKKVGGKWGDAIRPTPQEMPQSPTQ